MIKIKFKSGEKYINNRNLEAIIKDFDESDKEYEVITSVFNKINSEDELVKELKSHKDSISHGSILLCIKVLLHYSISQSNPILERVLQDG